jgi:hypothetical protein
MSDFGREERCERCGLSRKVHELSSGGTTRHSVRDPLNGPPCPQCGGTEWTVVERDPDR